MFPIDRQEALMCGSEKYSTLVVYPEIAPLVYPFHEWFPSEQDSLRHCIRVFQVSLRSKYTACTSCFFMSQPVQIEFVPVHLFLILLFS